MELFSNGNKFSVARKAGMQDVDLDETSEFIYQISKVKRFTSLALSEISAPLTCEFVYVAPCKELEVFQE